MSKLRNHLSITLLIVLLHIALVHNTCPAGFCLNEQDTSLAFELQNSFDFSRTTTTFENLDHSRKYEGTQVTTGWNSAKEISTYTITPELIWTINPINSYFKVEGYYGWVLNGKNIDYPFRWDIDGNVYGAEFEAGYFWNVHDLFKLIPIVGFQYNVTDTKIKNQRLSHSTIYSFISQNGKKSLTQLYFPYIGFELDFTSRFCNKYDVQFSFSYNFGYGGGHGRNKVGHSVITDLPSTSRFGSHVNYKNMILHDFEYAIAYSPTKKWTFALELEYNLVYNTRKLPLRFDHKNAFVQAGQFTRSQYHVVSDYVDQYYAVILALVYNFSGEGGGTFIGH